MNKNARIYVAGHNGLVGSSIVRALENRGYLHIIKTDSKATNLTNRSEVDRFMNWNRPEYVFLAAAKVGGILDNSMYPADYIYNNLMIQNNVIDASYEFGVKKLLFLGSSCIYPKLAKQPITEDQLLSGYLEPTNECYALAKIAGLKMCQAYNRQHNTNFISCMPTNLYGPKDNFDANSSHVIPGLINKFLSGAKEVVCFGDGTPMREFLYVDDLADACLFLMNNYDSTDTINIGTGQDITIKELAELIAELTNFKGTIVWDTSKPNGTPRKVLDVSKINNLGWAAKTSLREGLLKTIEWYKENK